MECEALNIRLIDCNEQQHAAEIMAIFNEVILNSTALYEYAPRTPEVILAWFASKRAAGFPIIGAIDDTGHLLGFASWGNFRNFPAYQHTVEHSIYLHAEHRGQGVGRLLLAALIQRAQDSGLHMLVAGIDASNQASQRLHLQFGFQAAGVLHEVGYKFGRWLDLAFYQLKLGNHVGNALEHTFEHHAPQGSGDMH